MQVGRAHTLCIWNIGAEVHGTVMAGEQEQQLLQRSIRRQ